MKINIVIGDTDLNWILGRLAYELHNRLGWSINKPGADVDYCIPYLNYKHATAPVKVGLFTHKERDGIKRKVFEEVYRILPPKCRIHLSQSTGDIFENIIHLGSDLKSSVYFGVAGKDHASGRKNFHWIPELKKDGFNITALSGTSEEDRSFFYKRIDYLVVTSSIEGGPVPVLDAIAMGVPVIAPDVGWCWEYPCIHYERDNLAELKYVMRKLSKGRTWKDVADDHKRIFEAL